MARHTHHLTGIVANFTTHTVGIFDGYVKKIAFACGLKMGNGALDHVSEIIELVAKILHSLPTLGPSPFVRMLGIHGARSVEIAVRLLRCSHNNQHAVDVGVEFRVGIGLHKVRCTLDCLVHIGVVERQTAYGDSVGRMCGLDEIIVTPRLLAFAESQGDGDVAARLEPLAPEIVGHFHRRERHLPYRIASVGLGRSETRQKEGRRQRRKEFFHVM